VRKQTDNQKRRPGAGRSTMSSLLDGVLGPGRLREQLGEIIALVESGLKNGPVPPPPVRTPLAGQPLGYTLADAAIGSPDAVEGFARGAVIAGRDGAEVLAWALPRANHPTESEAAVAAVTGVLRERGYDELTAWAAVRDDADPVQVRPPAPGIEPRMFVVPRRPYLYGRAVARRFANDFPYTIPAMQAASVFGNERVLFRPEVVPALAQEQSFQSSMAKMTAQEYEDVILPLSRIPGVNVLVMVALLLDEILDPMEVLGWIGEDIANPPRDSIPDRPEDIHVFNEPGTMVNGKPLRYMIFSDLHREPQQDLDFRIQHFDLNKALYLRAINYCEHHNDFHYIIIENGDCEELWYEPTFDPARRQTKLARLTDIMALHTTVYQKLAQLHADGRYFRSMGNHDSYLWEDPTLVAFRADPNNNFPPIHGGFVIPNCKTMDDFLPHIGLSATDYGNRADMFIVHGHHFDFWNCDDHNRLGKFITAAAAVPADALDNIIYDYRGIDRMGHPLIEFWDVLSRFTPWDSWPAKEVAREWAEAVEHKPLSNNLTLDSIAYSETLAAAIAFLMHSGGFDLRNIGVILCLGHTHNPQSRPWIPYLVPYNPWKEFELFGERVLADLFAIKTRYLNSGTVGWWEDLIWAIEITESGQPRLVYWSVEDDRPIGMDWELADQTAIPGSPLPALEDWADEYLFSQAAQALSGSSSAALSATEFASRAAAAGMERLKQVVTEVGSPDGKPDIHTLEWLLDVTTPGGLASPLDTVPRLALSASLARSAKEGNRAFLAALTLAARQNPTLGGGDPRSWPAKLSIEGKDAQPPYAPLGRLLWPNLLKGARRDAPETAVGVVDVLRALYGAYAPPVNDEPEISKTTPRPASAR
jgi:hypothetical protein